MDPDVIKGPKLTDPQKQTSAEGVPRPIVYGTAAVFGNVIQVQSVPTEHKKKKRTGKGGGPVQETYTYTRTAAIRICEAAPLGGEMMLRRVWMNGKLALDRTGTGDIDAESAKLLGEITFYSGAEDQLPDPDLEALPAEDGGGVGNVPAYRGTCYVVLRNVDVTNGGALPQFMWEVASCGTETSAATEWAITYPASGFSGTFKLSSDGDDWSASDETPSLGGGQVWNPSGGSFLTAHNGALLATCRITGASGANAAFRSAEGVWSECALTTSINSASGDSVWSGTHWIIGIAGSRSMRSSNGVTFEAFPGETGVSGDDFLGYAVASNGGHVYGYAPNGSGGWLFRTASDGTGQGRLDDPPSGYLVGDASMESDGSQYALAGYRGGGPYTIGIVGIGADGSYSDITSPFGSFATVPVVRVHHGLGQWWITADDQVAHGSSLGTLTLDPYTLPGIAYDMDDDGTKLIVCGEAGMLEKWTEADEWETLTSGVSTAILGIAALGASYSGTPVPDAPGYYVDDVTGEVVGPGSGMVTPCTPGLDEIVAELCDRSSVSDYDVTAVAGIEVRGFSVTSPVDAAGCIQALQQVYPFSFPEWGNSGDTGTKLRAVMLGGPPVVTITDDDLLETDDEETVRRQQVEFPRKVTLFAPDPDANYEATPQSAERESENVKATGEVSISTAVVLSRGEKAQVVDIAHKVLWEEANGTAKFELPEEFTRLVPSDPVIYDGRRYRINRVELGDGMVTVEGVRDRASAYSSNATANDTVALPPTQSGLRGPTMMHAMNLPSLRTSDNVPGMYISVCGRLAGWVGCDLYMSVDGGVSEQLVATIIDPATMGVLTAPVTDAGEPISIRLWNDDELDSVTADQLAARMNAAAITTDEVSEVLQFQTPTDTGERTYDLTDLARGLLGTDAEEHVSGDPIVILDGSEVFLPIDISHAGKTLIFRPVSRGTIPENNATYSFVYNPVFTSVTVSAITVGGEQITVSGQPIYVVNSNA